MSVLRRGERYPQLVEILTPLFVSGRASAEEQLRLGQSLGRMGRKDEALDVLTPLFRRMPAHPLVAEGYAEALEGVGRHDEAADVYLSVVDPGLRRLADGGVRLAGGDRMREVPGFLGEEEASALVEYAQRAFEAAGPPLPCFKYKDAVEGMVDARYMDLFCDPFEPVERSVRRRRSRALLTFSGGAPGSVLRKVNEKIARMASSLGLSKTSSMVTQIIKYDSESGAEGYRPHTDCKPGLAQNDRAVTALVYLNGVPEGGATRFTRIGVEVQPERGKLLLFNNLRPDGVCDLTSEHEAVPPARGGPPKWLLQKWFFKDDEGMQAKASDHEMFDFIGYDRGFLFCQDKEDCREYLLDRDHDDEDHGDDDRGAKAEL